MWHYWSVFLVVLFMLQSCGNKSKLTQHHENLDFNDTIPNQQFGEINLFTIQEIFARENTRFYLDNNAALSRKETVMTILDSIGLQYYYQLFDDQLKSAYIPMGCVYAYINIVCSDNPPVVVNYGDPSLLNSTRTCRAVTTTKSNLVEVISRVQVFDCKYQEDKMLVDKEYNLLSDFKIYLTLLFEIDGSREYDRL